MIRPLQQFFVAMGASVTLVLACVGSDVTVIGERYPALPPGCPVTIFPSTTPNYAWKDIASSQAKCNATAGRSACIERLKKDTCEVGGDTLYGFVDGHQSESVTISATIAHRSGGPVPATAGPAQLPPGSPPAAPALASDSGCAPPCSPGYQCQGTACIALCNPPCSTGMRCAQDRTCQPDRSADAGVAGK